MPGSGPPMEPPRLLPPHDSTAYILDRLLLPSPGLAKDGKPLPKRMAYLVGWHDLPAARTFVPAMQILEYVSPYAFEEWEYQMELELDEERAKMEKERTQHIPKPRGRGRPPKHSNIETAVVAEPQPEHLEAEWSKKGVMSVTSPTRRRMSAFGAVSEEVGSPSRRIEQDTLKNLMVADSNEEASDEFEITDFQGEPDPLSDHMQLDLMTESKALQPIASGEVSWLGRNTTMTSLQTPLQTEAVGSTATSSRRSTPKSSTAGRPPNKKSRASTMSNALKDASPRADKQKGKQPVSVNHRHSSFTPAGHSPRTPALEPETPLWAASSVPSQSKSGSKTKIQKSAQKPRKEKTPKSKQSQPKSKPPSEEAGKAEVGGEPQWEVKRLEDVQLYEVEGRGFVRYFKVRWEGDWPPDQNPSWEPEDNLPANLVRNYLKKGKGKASSSTSTPKNKPPKQAALKQTTLFWANGRQYKSVSEAFAGGADEDMDELAQGVEAQPEEEDDEQDELFVVEEPGKVQSRPSWNAEELGLFSMYR